MRFISKAAAKVQFFFDSAKCFVHKKCTGLQRVIFFALRLCNYTIRKSRDVVFPASLQSMFLVLCFRCLSVQPL